MNPGITREKALELIDQKCDFALSRHLMFVAIAMETLAEHFGHGDHKDFWFVTGLLHDIDWNETISCPEKHCGAETMKFLKEQGCDDEVLETIRSHYIKLGVPHDSDHRKALFACDELCGFIVASALVRPTKIIGMDAKSVIKKMKTKSFAAQVSRDDMKICEEYFDIPLKDFINLLIPSFERVASEWELT